MVKSNNAQKNQIELNKLYEKISIIELEEKENQKEKMNKPVIECKIIEYSNYKYAIRTTNVGGEDAYNINIITDEAAQLMLQNDEILPFEKLKPNKSFDLVFIVVLASKKKFKIITSWDDGQGNTYKSDEYLSW